MTLPEAEALAYLAAYHYRIAGHGERSTMKEWRDMAANRKVAADNAAVQAARYEQIERRAP